MIFPALRGALCAKAMSVVLVTTFMVSNIPCSFASQGLVPGLPQPGTMVNLSPSYAPLMITGLTIHPENPLLMDFIVNTGNTGMDAAAVKKESDRLIKYFLACLTIPEDHQWVNLSPYEKQRIIPDDLGQTVLGQDMLAQDYILKQLTASLIYPEKNLGKEFWDKVYAKAAQMYGTTQIPVNTFNKVWIIPEYANVYEHNNTVIVVKSHLKVMLDADYLALFHHVIPAFSNVIPAKAGIQNRINSDMDPRLKHSGMTNNLGSQIIREIVLPAIETEVNTGKNFAQLRQIYNSLILAVWFKKNLKEALLNQVYTGRTKLAGVKTNDPAIRDKIYQQYLQAYKKGVFNYIKEEPVGGVIARSPQGDEAISNGTAIARKYFSGGLIVPNSAMIHQEPNTDLGRDLAAWPSRGRNYIEKGQTQVVGNSEDSAMTPVPKAQDFMYILLKFLASPFVFDNERKKMLLLYDGNTPRQEVLDSIRSQMIEANGLVADEFTPKTPTKELRKYRFGILASSLTQEKIEQVKRWLINKMGPLSSAAMTAQEVMSDPNAHTAARLLAASEIIQQHRPITDKKVIEKLVDNTRIKSGLGSGEEMSGDIEIQKVSMQILYELLQAHLISINPLSDVMDANNRWTNLQDIPYTPVQDSKAQGEILLKGIPNPIRMRKFMAQRILDEIKTQIKQAALETVKQMVEKPLPSGKGFEDIQAIAQGNQEAIKRILDSPISNRDALKPMKVLATDEKLFWDVRVKLVLKYLNSRVEELKGLDAASFEKSKARVGSYTIPFFNSADFIASCPLIHPTEAEDIVHYLIGNFLKNSSWEQQEISHQRINGADGKDSEQISVFTENISDLGRFWQELHVWLNARQNLSFDRQLAYMASLSHPPVVYLLPNQKKAVEIMGEGKQSGGIEITRLGTDDIMVDDFATKILLPPHSSVAITMVSLGQKIEIRNQADGQVYIAGIKPGQILDDVVDSGSAMTAAEVKSIVSRAMRVFTDADLSHRMGVSDDTFSHEVYTRIQHLTRRSAKVIRRGLPNEKLPKSYANWASKDGGIDLNSKNLNLQSSGDKVKIIFNRAMIAQFERGDFSGVRIKILDVEPINLMPLLGLKEDEGVGH